MNELLAHIKLYTKNESSAGRLFHGRGKKFPKFDYFNIDYFPPCILLIFYREPEIELVDNLVAVLLENVVGKVTGIFYQKRFLKNAPTELIWGKSQDEIVCEIEGCNFALKIGQSQNIGFFLDMKEGRDFIRANSQDKKILNLFSYTCALSVFALKAKAKLVVNFDMSKGALKRAELNHRLNEIDLKKVKFFDHDIFKSFAKIKREGPYDMVIIDPPTDHGDHFKVDRDYPKLLRRLDEWLTEHGLVITCLNSPHHSFEYLIDLVRTNNNNLDLVEKRGFPLHFFETNPDSGLKILIWKKNGNFSE